nr:MAG TPA: hypothetical protein [Caudoviricetes sp.]
MLALYKRYFAHLTVQSQLIIFEFKLLGLLKGEENLPLY